MSILSRKEAPVANGAIAVKMMRTFEVTLPACKEKT